ncbi:hypothetical protein SLEP1_g40072 [Rubroshorea leprosula]|uniref:Uncharacterized protein n=1 Tax=Rubroshorea leprosula TaxID=152421 RepID=A0AAV5L2B6_9ROSI|nr:hypothetical protein SLEP1_g40072 [Rubroshorea leprosula]
MPLSLCMDFDFFLSFFPNLFLPTSILHNLLLRAHACQILMLKNSSSLAPRLMQ